MTLINQIRYLVYILDVGAARLNFVPTHFINLFAICRACISYTPCQAGRQVCEAVPLAASAAYVYLSGGSGKITPTVATIGPPPDYWGSNTLSTLQKLSACLSVMYKLPIAALTTPRGNSSTMPVSALVYILSRPRSISQGAPAPELHILGLQHCAL